MAADYDGDGKADIGIYRPSNGQWWLNRTTAGLIVTTFGTSTDKTVQADYTGDGKADVAFFRPSTREWFVLRSEDFSFYSAPFGAAGDIPTPGDYDGDGRTDFAIFRPSNNTWFIQQSTVDSQRSPSEQRMTFPSRMLTLDNNCLVNDKKQKVHHQLVDFLFLKSCQRLAR